MLCSFGFFDFSNQPGDGTTQNFYNCCWLCMFPPLDSARPWLLLPLNSLFIYFFCYMTNKIDHRWFIKIYVIWWCKMIVCVMILNLKVKLGEGKGEKRHVSWKQKRGSRERNAWLEKEAVGLGRKHPIYGVCELCNDPIETLTHTRPLCT